MLQTLVRASAVALTVIILCGLAMANPIPVGYVSWDVTVPGSTGQFDITNETGTNSSGDAIWPITTPVDLSSLSLTVDFSDGSHTTFGSSYFTLSSDGLSFDGSPIGIGGTSPQPTEAILTGTFSPTTITLFDGTTETIDSGFSATILPSSPPNLADGDLAVINATAGVGAVVPEPGYSWLLLGMILAGLGISRRRELSGKLLGLMRVVLPLALVAFSLLTPAAQAAVKQSGSTTPSSGTTGSNVNVTVTTGWPAGDTTPANITVTWATACGVPASATDSANSLKVIFSGSERVNATIPTSLTTGTYYVQVSDAAAGDTDFLAANCSVVQVTATSKTLESCVPASSLGVVAPLKGPAPVYAYVPNGAWGRGTTGFEVVQLETGGGAAVSPASIATTSDVNSCAGNPATGEAVCVANDTNVYHIGPAPANVVTTLTDGATGSAFFSGGTCKTCGVAINANTNQAVLQEGSNTAPSGDQMQVLDLSANTFETPFPMFNHMSENVVIDIPDSLVLSMNESNLFEVVGFDASGKLTAEYSMPVSTGAVGGEGDSNAVDCSTRIAIAPLEFTNDIVLTDLSQAAYVPGSPGSFTAPYSVIPFLSTTRDTAGPSGAAVAPGTAHLAVVTGEFGGSEFQVLLLPAAGGTGGAKPTLSDFADVTCVTGFTAGFDPHTVTAYVSPNDTKSYALFANWNSGGPNQLLKADMAGILALPRGADGHTVLGDGGLFTCLNPAGPVGSTVLTNIATH